MRCEKHNHDFDPLIGEGCPKCVAERRTAELASQLKEKLEKYLVKVRYYSQSTGQASEREYTYYSEEPLAVGDLIMAPTSNAQLKAQVSAIDVPMEEIEAFKDRVKSIPVGSKLTDQSLKYASEPAPVAELPSGGLAEAARNAGAEVAVVEMVDTGPAGSVQTEPPSQATTGGPVEGVTETTAVIPAVETVLVESVQQGLTEEEEDLIMAEGEPEMETGVIHYTTDMAVQALVEKANRSLQYAEGRVVNDSESERKAGEDLILIRNTEKQIKAKRKEYLDPVNAQAAEIRDFFKQLEDPIAMADGLTVGKILAYGKEVTRLREEAERIEEAALKLAREQEELTGEHTVSLAEIAKPDAEKKRVRSDLGVASKVDHWKWRIVKLSDIPREWMIPNEAMLNAVAQQSHDSLPVDGIEFYNDPHMATRNS